LLDQFTNDAVMNTYLLVYVVCHLVAYVLFGIALRRAGVIPLWAALAMISSSPLMVAAFAFYGRGRAAVGVAAVTLLLIGSLTAAKAMVARRRPSSP
jgi:hypothetical protein